MMAASNRVRVVFDCNIFLQALGFETGPPAAALDRCLAGDFHLFISKATLRELRNVLHKPYVREHFPHVTNDDIEDFLEVILFRSILLRTVPHKFEFSRDPDDAIYLDLATAARADFIVTRDKDLISLMGDHSALGKRFRQMNPSIRILNPTEFLRTFETRAS